MAVHKVQMHGRFKEEYLQDPVEIRAESLTMLLRLIFKSVFKDFLKKESAFTVVLEDAHGNFTEIYDPEQSLPLGRVTVHILPNPDGAYIQIVYAIIVAIVAVGVALLLAPKIDMNQDTASGANWQSPENVIGQGGATPVLLGTRLIGSRVVSHGIDSKLYVAYA